MVFSHMARAFLRPPTRVAPVQLGHRHGAVRVDAGSEFYRLSLAVDQLAFWAVTIGANIAQSPQELTDALGVTSVFDLGRMQKELILGAHYVGQEALIRFYVLQSWSCLLLSRFLSRFTSGGFAKTADWSGRVRGMTLTRTTRGRARR